MSDRFPCEVELRGEITTSQLTKAVEAAKLIGATLEWGEQEPSVESAIAKIEIISCEMEHIKQAIELLEKNKKEETLAYLKNIYAEDDLPSLRIVQEAEDA